MPYPIIRPNDNEMVLWRHIFLAQEKLRDLYSEETNKLNNNEEQEVDEDDEGTDEMSNKMDIHNPPISSSPNIDHMYG